ESARRGVEKTNVNDSFQIQHAADLYEKLYPLLDDTAVVHAERPMDRAVARFRGDVAQSVLDRMSAKYLASDRDLPLADHLRAARVDAVDPSLSLRQTPSALPRAYVVPRAVPLALRSGTAAASLRGLDPRQVVVLPRDPLPPGGRQAFTPATWTSRTPDTVLI